MRLFVLEQKGYNDEFKDENYKVIAQGVEFGDGRVCMQWLGDVKSIVIHDSLDNLQKISCFPSTEISRRITYVTN